MIFSSIFFMLFWIARASYSDNQHPLIEAAAVNEQEWKLNFSSSAPHYFFSVHSLLQQWPNTFFPNGHTLVPGTIPAFTKLYHGRLDADLPPSPEWLAFDIGMSYGIMGSGRNSHMLTYQTTHPVKVIHFDGESAALTGNGQLDTQMLHIWGNTSGPPHPGGLRGLRDEYARASGLCEWLSVKKLGGSGWGFEGIVRMNAGFEVIWCNFSSPSLRLMSHLNVTAPLLPLQSVEFDSLSSTDSGAVKSYELPPIPTRSDKSTSPTSPPLPPNWRRDMLREPFIQQQTWQWLTSAATHYGSHGSRSGMGEHRLKLETCGIMSYYDIQFHSPARHRAEMERKRMNLTVDGYWRGLQNNIGNSTLWRITALQELTKRRRLHTLEAVSVADAGLMREASERVLAAIISGNDTRCSGIDWKAVSTDIVSRYSVDLYNIRRALTEAGILSSGNYSLVRTHMASIRAQLHSSLVSFVEYPEDIDDEAVWRPGSATFDDAFTRCKYHHTRLLVPEFGVHLSPEEVSLKDVVEEVMHSICATTLTIGLSLESMWAREFNNNNNNLSGDGWRWRCANSIEVKRWLKDIEELMAWLGWASEWTRCEKICAWDEVCFIPMWPLIKMHFRNWPPKGGGNWTDNPPQRPPPEYGHDKPGHEPAFRYPYHGGYGSEYGSGDRGFHWDETELWEPRCVNADYIMSP